MSYLVVIPAYGRDYKNKAQVLEAWKAGKDFEIMGILKHGRYVNIHDKPASVSLQVRYGGNLKTMIIA
jgi:hypothetical protein